MGNSGNEQLVDFEGGSGCHLKMCPNFSRDVPLCCNGSRACEKEGVQSITAQCYAHTLAASREIHYIRASPLFFSLSLSSLKMNTPTVTTAALRKLKFIPGLQRKAATAGVLQRSGCGDAF
jgi:hypothetical protein